MHPVVETNRISPRDNWRSLYCFRPHGQTMTKYWAFARGGAWRNPKPTGGPYVCEQCRLDARGGNDATLTIQAVTTIELTPTDVCADCGARLLENQRRLG